MNTTFSARNRINDGHGSAIDSIVGTRSSRRRMNRGLRRSRTIFATRILAVDTGSLQPEFDGMRPGGQPVRKSQARDGQVSGKSIGKDAVGVEGS